MGSEEIEMALIGIVVMLYVIDILYYMKYNDSWGIGNHNVEYENIDLQHPLLFKPFPYSFMLCLVFGLHFLYDLLIHRFIPDVLK